MGCGYQRIRVGSGARRKNIAVKGHPGGRVNLPQVWMEKVCQAQGPEAVQPCLQLLRFPFLIEQKRLGALAQLKSLTEELQSRTECCIEIGIIVYEHQYSGVATSLPNLPDFISQFML